MTARHPMRHVVAGLGVAEYDAGSNVFLSSWRLAAAVSAVQPDEPRQKRAESLMGAILAASPKAAIWAVFNPACARIEVAAPSPKEAA